MFVFVSASDLLPVDALQMNSHPGFDRLRRYYVLTEYKILKQEQNSLATLVGGDFDFERDNQFHISLLYNYLSTTENKYGLGLSYRHTNYKNIHTANSAIVLLHLQFQNLLLVCQYHIHLTRVRQYNSGTHEINVGFRICKKAHSPVPCRVYY
jgi:hypothetical protein